MDLIVGSVSQSKAVACRLEKENGADAYRQGKENRTDAQQGEKVENVSATTEGSVRCESIHQRG